MPEQAKRKHKRRHRSTADEGPRPNRTIFVLLVLIPILAAIAYGGTALWAMMLIGPLVAVLGTVWLVRAWRTAELTLSTDPLLYPVAALLVFALFQLLPFGNSSVTAELLSIPASSALTADPYSTRIFAVRMAGYLIFFAAALTFVDTEKRLRKLVGAIAIFGGAIAFAGIIQWLASPDAIYGVRPTPQAIPFGPYVNRHHFASLMVLFSGVALAQIFSRSVSREKKLLFAISAILMAAAVVLTGSRGGILAYIAMFAVCVLAVFRRSENDADRPSRLPIAIGSAAFLVLIVGLVIFLGGADPLLRGFGIQNTGDDVSSGRLHFWSVAWQVFLSNPVFGAGMEAFGVAYTQFDSRNGFYRTEQAHNDYLQMLADGGIVGFAIVVSFVVLLAKKGVGVITASSDDLQRVTRIGAFAGCVGILVHSFFDFPLRTASNAFFFLLVAAMMAAYIPAKSGRDRS